MDKQTKGQRCISNMVSILKRHNICFSSFVTIKSIIPYPLAYFSDKSDKIFVRNTKHLHLELDGTTRTMNKENHPMEETIIITYELAVQARTQGAVVAIKAPRKRRVLGKRQPVSASCAVHEVTLCATVPLLYTTS